ncbi:unnamed protein product, partial [Bubo scandiacus]
SRPIAFTPHWALHWNSLTLETPDIYIIITDFVLGKDLALKNPKLLSCQGLMDAYRKKESNYGKLCCSSWSHDEGK